MNKLDALREFLAKVEAGEWDTALAFQAFDGNHLTTVSYTYNGSLDAAKALHKAVLPFYEINLTFDFCHVFPPVDDGEQRAYTGLCDKKPARAWLIAILKALIAQDEHP